MTAKRPAEPPKRFHSAIEVRMEVDRLKRDLNALEAVLDAKLTRSIYRVRADVPRRVK